MTIGRLHGIEGIEQELLLDQGAGGRGARVIQLARPAPSAPHTESEIVPSPLRAMFLHAGPTLVGRVACASVLSLFCRRCGECESYRVTR